MTNDIAYRLGQYVLYRLPLHYWIKWSCGS